MAVLLSLFGQIFADDLVHKLCHRLFPLFRYTIQRRDKLFIDFW